MSHKMTQVDLVELSALMRGAKSAEECTDRLAAYKAIIDGSAQTEAEARKIAEAKEAQRKAENAAINRSITTRFNAISNAIEEAIDKFNEFDACEEEDEETIFEYESSEGKIAIEEIEEGYIVSLRNHEAIVTDLNDQKQISQLVRYFQHC